MSHLTNASPLLSRIVPKSLVYLTMLIPALAINTLGQSAGETDEIKRNSAEIEATVRLQIFLDEAEFSPRGVSTGVSASSPIQLCHCIGRHGMVSPPL